MSKEQALKILRRLRGDDGFRTAGISHIDKTAPEIAQFLNANGLGGDEKDWLLALDADWMISALEETGDAVASQGNYGRKKSAKLDLREELQNGLVRVVQQIDRGYARTMTMYTIAFYLGVGMVLASIIASLIWHEDASPLILGGMGMASVIASLIFRPAQDLQDSRGSLAQLQATFFSWINDINNWNRYLEMLDKGTSASNQPPLFKSVREVSDVMMQNTERLMLLITRYRAVASKSKTEGRKNRGRAAAPSDEAPAEHSTKR